MVGKTPTLTGKGKPTSKRVLHNILSLGAIKEGPHTHWKRQTNIQTSVASHFVSRSDPENVGLSGKSLALKCWESNGPLSKERSQQRSKLVRSRIKVCREFHSNINVCLTKIFKCVEVFNIKHCMILSNNVDHLLLNLTLSDIMVSLANASTLQKDSSWIERIRKFVTETLEDGSRLNSKQLNRLLGVSWRLMQMQSNRDGCQCSATESLIKAVYTLYQQRGLLLPVPTLLLKFFSKSYQKEELRSYRIQYRSKVLSRWLAGLPLQLAHLGSRNPELSTQLIDIIHTAAARANKELLKSLQVTALRIYDPQEGTVVVLSAESQQLLVQLVYFLPSLPADLLSRLSCCCIMGRLSANLAAMLIGILHMRSSFSEWKSSVKEWNGSDQLNISNEDYFSFLFSTLTGFSKEELTWLQSLRGVPHVIQTQLSPLLLYLTDLDQFSHHWDVTEYRIKGKRGKASWKRKNFTWV
ncbi:hypothetical protein FD754_023020, partial [Muntiacus muntjak]